MIHRASNYSLLNETSTNDQATCDRKIRYHSKQKAKEAKARAERQYGKMYIYECPACHEWHLSSHDPSSVRELRRR